MKSSQHQDIQISLSHDERICLTVAGYGSQGCDIEPVKARTQQEWLALLGNRQQFLLQELMAGNDSLDRAGTRIWVALESLLKAQALPESVPLHIERQNGDSVLFRADASQFSCKVLTFPIQFTRGEERVVAVVVQADAESAVIPSDPAQEPLILSSEVRSLAPSRVQELPEQRTLKVTQRKRSQGLRQALQQRWMTLILALKRVIRYWSNYHQEQKKAELLTRLGYDPNLYGITGEITPTGHLVFVYRFPLTFKANANLSGSVYFSQYLTWMGAIRELAMYPVSDRIVTDFTLGHWGMVTNYSQIRFFGESHKNDVLEVRLWMGDITGPTQSTFCLYYDWCRILANGHLERVALGEVQLTWVEVLDHGVVKPEPFPAYFQDFLDQRIPPSDRSFSLPSCPEAWQDLAQGKELYRSSGHQSSRLLREQSFLTTLEDSNLVGNLYFSNYYVWQGRIRDRFFYEQSPEHFRGRGEQGEFLCLFSQVKHLREAMPFEKIQVTMALQTLFECGMELTFEYFRLTAQGERQKLALGQHEVIWVRRSESGEVRPIPLPQTLRLFLLRSVNPG